MLITYYKLTIYVINVSLLRKKLRKKPGYRGHFIEISPINSDPSASLTT
jgi:hypothetical protein